MAEPNTAERPKLITADRFHEAMVAAGVLRDGERIRRIVIDAQAGHAVLVYVERFGDERLLDVVPTLDGIEVHNGRPEVEQEPARGGVVKNPLIVGEESPT